MKDCSQWRSAVVELDRFTDASGPRYRARSRSGKQYLISEVTASLLAALDGKRTSADIAATFSTPDQLITPSSVNSIVESSLLSTDLVESVNQPQLGRDESRSVRQTRGPFDFVLRVPLLTAAQIEPLTNLCSALFRPPLLHLCIFAGVLAHIAFYGQPYFERLRVGNALGGVSTWQIAIVYALALGTMVLHELGHAAACRKYGCEHAEIGFCLYLIFPALYIDLSKAWGLPRLQRAVIDIGGIYFQFLSVVLLVISNTVFPSPLIATSIYAADLMIVLSLNPLFRSDGYWLLSDLTSFANLQRRALSLLKDLITWPLRKRVAPLLTEMRMPHKVLFVTYSAVLATGIVIGAFHLVWSVPVRIRDIATVFVTAPATIHEGAGAMIHSVGKLLGALVLFAFIARLLYRFWLTFSSHRHRISAAR